MLICRADRALPEDERRKIALFTNVPVEAVISAPDMDSVYKIPGVLQRQMLDEIVCHKLGILARSADLSAWDALVSAIEHPLYEVDIALVGKYVGLTESYKSLTEALIHAGIHKRARIQIHYVDSEQIENEGTKCLEGMDAILVPGGFGKRGVDGKIKAIQYARESGIPYLGICLGMQLAVVEFARHCAQLPEAHSTEFESATPDPVIALITEFKGADGQVEHRSADSNLGGTMRLGGQECLLEADSLARRIYGKERIVERHRHRYEVNNQYLPQLRSAGLRTSGLSAQEDLCEMIELPGHPWFVACQFHPEFTSTPRGGHPLFESFIEAALRQRGVLNPGIARVS